MHWFKETRVRIAIKVLIWQNINDAKFELYQKNIYKWGTAEVYLTTTSSETVFLSPLDMSVFNSSHSSQTHL